MKVCQIFLRIHQTTTNQSGDETDSSSNESYDEMDLKTENESDHNQIDFEQPSTVEAAQRAMQQSRKSTTEYEPEFIHNNRILDWIMPSDSISTFTKCRQDSPPFTPKRPKTPARIHTPECIFPRIDSFPNFFARTSSPEPICPNPFTRKEKKI